MNNTKEMQNAVIHSTPNKIPTERQTYPNNCSLTLGAAALYSSVQVDDNVDGRNENLGRNKNND